MLWMDGRLGGPGPCSVARCQATVTLPLRCATGGLTPARHAPTPTFPAQSPLPCHPIHHIDHIHIHIDRRGPLPYRLTVPRGTRIVRASVPRSQLDSQGHTNAHTVGHHRPASQVLRSPPSLSTGEDRSRATSGPGLDYPPSQLAIGHRLGAPSPRDHDAPGHSRPGLSHPPPAKSSAPLQCCQLAKGRAHWNRPPWHVPGDVEGRGTYHASSLVPRPSISRARAQGHRRRPAATQALRLALGGKGPRPVHPVNWRRVLDVESRPSGT